MNKNISVLILLLLLFVTKSYAFYYTHEGTRLSYSIIDENAKTCNVSADGTNFQGTVIIPSTVKNGTTEYTVVAIKNKGFYWNTLTSVEIPNTVTEIGEQAFRSCYKLTSIKMSSNTEIIGDYAFSGCDVLTSINLGNAVTSIGGQAFYGCTALTSLIMPNSVISIGTSMCWGCTALTSVSLSSSITSISDKAFSGCSNLTSLKIPNSVTSIGNESFYNCKGLKSIIFSDNLTSIGKQAFYYCSNLESIEFPNSLTSIDNNAFLFCEKLKSVILPKSVKYCPSFGICKELRKCAYPNTLKAPFTSLDTISYNPNDVLIENGFIFNKNKSHLLFVPISITGEYTIPGTVTTIGDHAFSYCEDLNKANLPSTVISIGKDAFQNCYNLTAVNLSNSLLFIGDYAFWQCKKLSAVTIPNNVKTIGSCAFLSCSSLSSVTIGNGVSEIPKAAFEGCDNLTYLTLGTNISSVDIYAFRESTCANLKQITVLSKTPLALKSAIFEGAYNNATLIIPDDAIQNYLNKGWAKFRNIKLSDSKQVLTAYNDGVLNYLLLPTSSEYGKNYAYVVPGDYSKLSTVQIPERFTYNGSARYYVKGIAGNAFSNCSNIKELTFNDRTELTSIGYLACGNTNIASVSIPPSVSTISELAFYNCSNLSKLVIQDEETPLNLGPNAFRYASIKDLYLGRDFIVEGTEEIFNSDIKTLTIGNFVTQIVTNAFNGAPIETLTMGSGVINIGNNAFKNNKIKSLVLPPSVETIGESAFGGSYNLATISMGSKVKNIGANAFSSAPVEKIYITAQTPPTAENSSFTNYSGKLFLQGNNAVNAYYDALVCWDRFNGYKMSTAIGIKVEKIDADKSQIKDNFKLFATLEPSSVDLPYVFWKSTDNSIATVDVEGNVVVLNNDPAEMAKCSIIAETLYHNGPVFESSVLELWAAPVETLTLDQTKWTGPVNSVIQLTAKITPDGAAIRPISWSSSNIDVAVVAPGGVVMTIAPGKATITATCDGRSASCEMIVEADSGVSDIKIDGKEPIIYNLQGMPVKNPGKGIYIINGRKVIFN